MASNDNNGTSNTGKGGKNNNASRNRSAAAAEDDDTAAAEREPPPYDPRQFQNPHPDDRDGGKTKTTTKANPTKDTSGKAAADGSHCCYQAARAVAERIPIYVQGGSVWAAGGTPINPLEKSATAPRPQTTPR